MVGDTADVVGFDDDARVVNAVTAALGRSDLAIQAVAAQPPPASGGSTKGQPRGTGTAPEGGKMTR